MLNKSVDKLLLFLFVFSIIIFAYRDGYTYIYKIIACLLVLLFLARLILLRYKLITPIEFVIAGLWLSFTLLSGLFAISFNTFIGMFLTVLQVILICYVICNLLIWMDRPLYPLFATFWSTLFLSILVFLNPMAYSVGGRLEGTLGNANLYGFVLLISIMFAFHQFFNLVYFLKYIYLTSIPFLFYILVETGSRKAMISVVLFIGLYSIIKFKNDISKKPIRSIVTLILLIVTGFSSLTYLKQTRHYERLAYLVDAVQSGSTKKNDESTYARYQFYEKGYRIVSEHPILGVGLDNFRNESSGSLGKQIGTYAHSNYIELLADTGILGFVLYYTMYIALIIKGIKLWVSNISTGDIGTYLLVTCLFTVYILYDFAMVSYFDKFSWLMLTVIITSYKVLIVFCSRSREELLYIKTRDTSVMI